MAGERRTDADAMQSKVPAVTLGFWIIKIAATTLGETAGDTVTMTMNLGYLVGTTIFLTVLIALVAAQIAITLVLLIGAGLLVAMSSGWMILPGKVGSEYSWSAE